MIIKQNGAGMEINDSCKGYVQSTPQVIVLRMTGMSIINYSYLIVDPVSKLSVIVDPAWDMDKIEKGLLQTGSTLSGVLLTHAHPDHTHLAEPLAIKHHCLIWMAQEEIDESGYHPQQLMGLEARPWQVGEMEIQPILTPGHTPGSTCFLIGNNLFSGDTLFAEGCGICPGTQAAYSMFASLQYLKSRLDPNTRIYPGHVYGKSPGQVFSTLFNDNIYLQFKNEQDFASYRLRPGQSKSNLFNFK